MTACDQLWIGRGVGTPTAPEVVELTAAKSGRSSATGAQLRLVRAHQRRCRNHRDAVLLAGGADAVRVRWRQSRALARE